LPNEAGILRHKKAEETRLRNAEIADSAENGIGENP